MFARLKNFVIPALLALPMAAQGAECWTTEMNPHTQVPYSSAKEYNKDLTGWRSQQPPVTNLLELAIAYDTYKKEREISLSLGSDKRAHCYMGCRIAQKTSYATADYVGWKKEEKDLTDCQISSHFEPVDYEVTVFGAEAAAAVPKSTSGCTAFCTSNVP